MKTSRIFSSFDMDDEAMKAFDRALAIKPEAYIYYNRAMTRPQTDVAGPYLRLGRFDDAIADYDKALAASPNLPTSLFGRAVARARKGETGKAREDAAAARKISPKIRARFEGFGFSLDDVPGTMGSTSADQ